MANYDRLDYRGANLRGADFRGANLRDANLAASDVTGADFTGADLRGVKTEGNIKDSRGWDKAKLEGATLIYPDYFNLDQISNKVIDSWITQNTNGKGLNLSAKQAWLYRERFNQRTSVAPGAEKWIARKVFKEKTPFQVRAADLREEAKRQAKAERKAAKTFPSRKGF